MQKARRYQGRRKTENEPRNFGRGVLCALIVSVALFILLLLAISLVEWLMPDLFDAYGVYIATAVPVVSVGVGAYVGSRRLARKAVWLGGVNGIVCWLIGIGIAWCSGVDITIAWLGVSLGVCLIVSLIGALPGVLRVR